MDKAIATKWVKALRSGKYKQGQGYLKTSKRHCCLGVLCEVQNIKLIEMDTCLFGSEQPSYDAIGKITGDKLGLSTDKYYISLTALNDSGMVDQERFGDFNFDEIADIIQAVEILRVLD